MKTKLHMLLVDISIELQTLMDFTDDKVKFHEYADLQKRIIDFVD